MHARALPFVIALTVASPAVAAIGCAVPDVAQSSSNVNGNRKATPDKKNDGDNENDNENDNDGADKQGEDDTRCSDACTLGTKRCSSQSSAGTEVCAKGADGCARWTQGTDCADGSQCDVARNDGTCKAGCTNDPGCSGATVGQRRCSSTGTAEVTCSASGACFVYKTTRSGIPQECSGTGNFCSGGDRFTCLALKAGECVQHTLQRNSCGAGTTCSGGSCVSTTSCTDQCVRNARRCSSTANARQDCVMANNGCTVWTSTSCASSHICFDGVCGPP